MTGETVLVTGASGFIATHCILQLLEKGYRVRGTLRTPARGDAIRALLTEHGADAAGVQFVAADLTSDDGWEIAVEGCDHVLHVASPIPITLPRDENELIVPARDGALRVLRAANAAGLKRVVMTSSTAAIVYGHETPPDGPYTEATWSDVGGGSNTAYTRSKTFAERAAWDFVQGPDGAGLELATVNPGMVLGPILEKDFGASPEIVRQMLTGAMPALPRFGFPTVDVRDVADLHLRAMTAPEAAGERFLATESFVWMLDMAAHLREAFPDRARKIPTRELPDWVVRAYAMVNPPIRQITPELGRRRDTSSEKAQRILGWTPRPWREAATATAQSLIRYGVV